MKLTLLSEISKVVHFAHLFLCVYIMYSHFEFELKNDDTMFTVSEIQTVRKLNNPTGTLLAGLSLPIIRFSLLK